jgi:integrase
MALAPRPRLGLPGSALYRSLEDKIAPMTQHHVHTVFSSCLSTAVRKGLLRTSPMMRIDQVPSKGEADHGIALSETELGTLVDGFKASPALYPVVALAAATGCRRNELLALRWTDLDVTKRTLRIERALDFTKKFGIKFKVPKTERGKRTIELDDGAVTMLLKEKERHLRVKAGVADNAGVSLSLTRLPADALMFPGAPAGTKDFSFTASRNPRNFTKEFLRRAKRLGFTDLRFHDLRGTHATQLLNRGVPVHVVAQRLGDDAAVVLRSYAKNIPDKSMSDVLGALASGLLKS